MTNWFASHAVSPIYGWGLTKRWIVQAGPAIPPDANMHEVAQQLRTCIEQAAHHHCIYVEVRCMADYSPWHEAFIQAGFTYQPHYDVVFEDLLSQPYTQEWPTCIPQPKRRQIRKAMDSGQSWRETDSDHDLHVWYRLLRRLYWWRLHRPLPCEVFFRRMMHHEGCKLLVVEDVRKTIIGGVFLAADNTTAYEWYICGQLMSTWAAIDWCRQHAISRFDTMGAGVPGVPYGVRDFKLQMGGTLKEWGRYLCVLHPHVYRAGALGITLLQKWCHGRTENPPADTGS